MPIAISRSTALVLVSVTLAALVLLGQRFAQVGAATESEVVAAPLEPATTTPSRTILVVHVVGEVRRPGLYRLRDGARIADAVRRAGGASRTADLAALNLAAPLVDGIQVLVPSRVAAPPGEAAGGAGEGANAGVATRVSLSSATVDELDELPGVGPVTAQKIIDYRMEHGPFASVDDLDAVPGIGPTRIEQLRDLVTP
ncbi:MAG TPA: ComEA family DNA-binding protein [Gaiellaceae bacterium]|nr:ComEA family DNA-binding protein [Gaiellaceae bacterium]